MNICNSLGFCASYNEATLYEVLATFASPPVIKPETFVQFLHDNADFNIYAIGGKRTFYYTGSIEIVTPVMVYNLSDVQILFHLNVNLLEKIIIFFKYIQRQRCKFRKQNNQII